MENSYGTQSTKKIASVVCGHSLAIHMRSTPGIHVLRAACILSVDFRSSHLHQPSHRKVLRKELYHWRMGPKYGLFRAQNLESSRKNQEPVFCLLVPRQVCFLLICLIDRAVN